MANNTTPFPGNASTKFQQNLNRLPTGGDRIPAPRLLSISRQLESRAERGCSNRRSRPGSAVQRYTGRRNSPRPAENRSGARERDVAGRRLDLAVPEQLADHRKDTIPDANGGSVMPDV